MFGARIKALREERDISQTDLAKIINVSSSALNRYEKELREPDSAKFNELANYFNVSVDYLLGRTDNRYSEQKKFVSGNINLIKGDVTFEELSLNMGMELKSPLYSKVFTADYLEQLAKGKIIPKQPRIESLAEYAQVFEEFFYRENTLDDLRLEKEEYKKFKNTAHTNFDGKRDSLNETLLHMEFFNKIQGMNINPDELFKLLLGILDRPGGIEYLYIAKDICDKGIRPKDVVIGFSLGKYKSKK